MTLESVQGINQYCAMGLKLLAQRKQGQPLIGFELTPDRHPTSTSQTRESLQHVEWTFTQMLTKLRLNNDNIW